MARMVGVVGHKAFVMKMGQLDRFRTELPESAEPLVPKRWGELNTMTIAFGQGLNVAPIQAVVAGSAPLNGGRGMAPPFLPRPREGAGKNSPPAAPPPNPPSRRPPWRFHTHPPPGAPPP